MGITIAIQQPAKQDEQVRHIYTDSLNSLYLLQKAQMTPLNMQLHEYWGPVKLILMEAAKKKQINGQTMQVVLHKVRAHTGIHGNVSKPITS